MAMNMLWVLSLYEAVTSPAMFTVLQRMAKQEGKSLPKKDQLLRGLFLSQTAAFAVVGLLFMHERVLLLLCMAIGSWAVTTMVLTDPRSYQHGSPHPRLSNQVNLDVKQGHQPQASSMIDRQGQCAFFNYSPQEIRDIVYRHLLIQNSMITEVDSLVDSKIASIVLPVPRSRRGLDATVLRTCRRVYHEALPILYGENWFSFDNVAAIKTFSVRGLEYDESVRSAWPDAAGASEPPREPFVRNRLSMIRHLALEIGPLRARGFRQQASYKDRPELLEAWGSFIHPEPYLKPRENLELEFPALQGLYLNFSELLLDAYDVIRVQAFIRKFKKGKGLGMLFIRGLDHQASLRTFKNELVKEGGIFQQLT